VYVSDDGDRRSQSVARGGDLADHGLLDEAVPRGPRRYGRVDHTSANSVGDRRYRRVRSGFDPRRDRPAGGDEPFVCVLDGATLGGPIHHRTGRATGYLPVGVYRCRVPGRLLRAGQQRFEGVVGYIESFGISDSKSISF
jgi:hypothetical protein